jgi:hypothetical protein
MGTTTALKNMIGGGVCKFDGSSSDCTHRRGIVCCPGFQETREPSKKKKFQKNFSKLLLILFLCFLHCSFTSNTQRTFVTLQFAAPTTQKFFNLVKG